ncbi:MAG: hypothetical protein JO247_05240 [Chloroflexi bacterium]|nr:hypothetical protein [Chloroflexota bacterium]
MTLPSNWPDHIIHETQLHEVLGHSTGDEDALGTEEAQRVQRFRELVERARTSGRIKRYAVKDPTSLEIVGRGYSRDALKHIAGIRRPRLQVPRPPNGDRRELAGWKPAARGLKS